MNQRLGGYTTDVDAGTAVHFLELFDHGNLLALPAEGRGESLTTLAPADDSNIDMQWFGQSINICAHLFDGSYPCKLRRSPQLRPRTAWDVACTPLFAQSLCKSPGRENRDDKKWRECDNHPADQPLPPRQAQKNPR